MNVTKTQGGACTEQALVEQAGCGEVMLGIHIRNCLTGVGVKAKEHESIELWGVVGIRARIRNEVGCHIAGVSVAVLRHVRSLAET